MMTEMTNFRSSLRPTIIHRLNVALLVLLLVGTHSYAAENCAMVAAFRGEVSVISNGKSRPLHRGDFIALNDTIVAASRSFTVLQFYDGSKVSLRPDSSVLVEQFEFGGSGEGAATLQLLSGGMKLTAGVIATSSPENFRIRTPAGLWAVSARESSLTLCGDEVCEPEGLDKIAE